MEDEEMGEELSQKLTENWDEMIKTQPATVQFNASSVKQIVGNPAESQFELIKFFNPKLDINRFFIEDSDGKKQDNGGQGGDMPGVEFGAGGTGFADNSDPFENELDDALNVFKSGGENNDIIKNNENLVMFYVDLDEEQFIEKHKEGEENKEDEGQEMGQK